MIGYGLVLVIDIGFGHGPACLYWLVGLGPCMEWYVFIFGCGERGMKNIVINNQIYPNLF